MEDFLGLTALEETGEGTIIGMPKAFRDFTDMFAVDYNLLKDELKTQDGKEVTLEDYLLSLKSAGEFSHKMDKPVLEFISAVLDVTAVKPLIECCTGYDMITGEDLSDFERGMKAVSGLVSLFTLGQGSIVMNGGKLALGETVKLGAKILAVDAVSTGVAYGTSEICQAMGCPGGLTLVLSMLAGMGSSAGLGSKVFGNGGVTPDDIAYQRHWNEGVSGTDSNKLLNDIGKFNDDLLESNYQKYVQRNTKAGKEIRNRLDWKKASDYWTKESPIARGNNFNQTVRDSDIYPYHEINLSNGKRLDSYDPVSGEIISRKATDLDKISDETYRGYLSEILNKYSEGTVIRSNKYPQLDGLELKGQYILEIPASNATLSNIKHYKEIAKEYNVILRFTEELK